MNTMAAARAVAAAAGTPVAKIRLLRAEKTFQVRGQGIEAVHPTDLDIRPHEFIALVGPSGCGKSTILNMIAGLMRPTAGEVLYDDQPVSGPNRRVGYMTQKDTLLPWRTTRDNIRIALELKSHATPRAEADERVRQMIELVGLTGFENHTPAELSGGMRKRAAMARTLIYEPETLLMDEPFGALDSQLKLLMLDQLQSLTQHRHMSVVFVTHDLGEAITLSDRIVVMSARPGRIRAIHDVKLERPRDVFKVRFTPAFSEQHERLWDELKDDIIKGTDV
ncbi:MAG: sulfonate transport system ATP-binding protein [Hyphomicrobiales bacterium]|jgi:NitT/TauT family transport system ATP-binding protein|nr:sulfonate transport system ATP-binding protein [Hyphomicrobiales bacterium]